MTQPHDAPVSITSARSAHSDDIRRRQLKYLVSMGVRTLCFVLAVVLPSPERWVMVAGAFLLPYFAVVVANAADGRQEAGPARFADQERPQIEAADRTAVSRDAGEPAHAASRSAPDTPSEGGLDPHGRS